MNLWNKFRAVQKILTPILETYLSFNSSCDIAKSYLARAGLPLPQ
jgi:hypothetical protein